MTQQSLLRPIDELNLIAAEMQITPGRVIEVQRGAVFDHQRRLRVIDDYQTTHQTTVAEAVCTQGCAKTVSMSLMIQYGAEKVIEQGTFREQGTGLRYKIPQSYQTRQNPNLISEPDAPAESRGR